MFLLDSVIFIDHFNKIKQATHFLKENRANIHISDITRAEVLTGFSEQYFFEVKLFLAKFVTVTITNETAETAALLRRQYRWKLPDAFQAAIALQNNLKLITRNTKDFNSKEHSFVKIPYQI